MWEVAAWTITNGCLAAIAFTLTRIARALEERRP